MFEISVVVGISCLILAITIMGERIHDVSSNLEDIKKELKLLRKNNDVGE